MCFTFKLKACFPITDIGKHETILLWNHILYWEWVEDACPQKFPKLLLYSTVVLRDNFPFVSRLFFWWPSTRWVSLSQVTSSIEYPNSILDNQELHAHSDLFLVSSEALSPRLQGQIEKLGKHFADRKTWANTLGLHSVLAKCCMYRIRLYTVMCAVFWAGHRRGVGYLF